MAVNPVSGSDGSAATSTKRSDVNALGSEQFLTLMVTQLKNQDPFKPMDPTQYVSQLAQFSSVSGIQEMNKSITSLSDAMRGSQVLGGTSLVGHEVLADAASATIGAEGSVRGAIEIPKGTSAAKLVITDAAGQVVRHMDLPTQEGTTDFSWDGKDDQGARLAAGTYKLTAVANVGGQAYQINTSLVSKVGSVTIDPTTSSLTLNTQTGPVALSAVRRVM